MSLLAFARRAPSRAAILFTAVTLGVAAGCNGDAGTAPSGTPPSLRKEVVDPAVSASVLLRTRPLTRDMSAVVPIGPKGGTFFVPSTGLTVVVPPNAVSTTVWFTVTARRGSLVAYEFGPHGTVFNVPLVLTQDLTNTVWRGGASAGTLEAGYYASSEQLDPAGGKALINEFLPITLKSASQSLQFQVRHFSGYVIATGRGPRS